MPDFDERFEKRMERKAEKLLEEVLMRQNWTVETRDNIAAFLTRVVQAEMTTPRREPVGKVMKR